jgi:hypothetical protein
MRRALAGSVFEVFEGQPSVLTNPVTQVSEPQFHSMSSVPRRRLWVLRQAQAKWRSVDKLLSPGVISC